MVNVCPDGGVHLRVAGGVRAGRGDEQRRGQTKEQRSAHGAQIQSDVNRRFIYFL